MLSELIFFLIVFLVSAIMHEYSHGFVANQLGDPTAKYAGRLTLNPIPHIDPIGTIVLPLLLFTTTGFLFGWARPVPYNPYNLRYQRWGSAIVGAAGPFTNVLIALVFALTLRFAASGIPEGILPFLLIIVQANLILGIFNLLPIPPLDGSKVLFALLPSTMEGAKEFLERYGFILLLALIFLGQGIVVAVLEFAYRLFLGA
jgi:Zn-dependent protease